MERLTKRSNKTVHDNGVCCTHFNGYECSERMGECTDNCPWEEAVWSKLADYEDKQEQGLLIELPCKVGDKVYLADKIHGKVEVSIVEHIEYIVNTNANFPFTKIKGEGFCIFFDDFGKLVFLTRSEAEEALVKMGGK